MDGNQKSKKRIRAVDIIYIIVIIILTILAIVGSILIRRFEYIAGLRNDTTFGLTYGFGLSLILTFVMIPIAINASIVAIIHLVLRHSNIRQILLNLVLILLGPVICYCAFEYTAPLAPVFLEGFEQWVLQEADIDAIQNWLASEGAQYEGQYYSNFEESFPEELPECLTKLNPFSISFIDSDSQNGPRVEITWIMLTDEYGLIIGSPAMETPERGHIELDSSTVEFRHPVKPGAYVFSRG